MVTLETKRMQKEAADIRRRKKQRRKMEEDLFTKRFEDQRRAVASSFGFAGLQRL